MNDRDTGVGVSDIDASPKAALSILEDGQRSEYAEDEEKRQMQGPLTHTRCRRRHHHHDQHSHPDQHYYVNMVRNANKTHTAMSVAWPGLT